MKYCSECGTKLILKECGIDGEVPYCPTCKQFRFPVFNSAISTIIFNPTKDKILLIKQYGKDFNVLVAGYITKGENAKETLIREIKEEVSLNVVEYTYNDNEYYQPCIIMQLLLTVKILSLQMKLMKLIGIQLKNQEKKLNKDRLHIHF